MSVQNQNLSRRHRAYFQFAYDICHTQYNRPNEKQTHFIIEQVSRFSLALGNKKVIGLTRLYGINSLIRMMATSASSIGHTPVEEHRIEKWLRGEKVILRARTVSER